ncbi:N-acetylmuramic acid 6-phosphate etherase [Salinicoccus albus]|uniref:N-acetylmuramic acid 6-phosphate etherase n=1 Tax=Salinicoccus albus TaxID=418756 RepID=UPI00036CE061|nr:N-acetylmuramic acid 6-phosphate etherase [Salinicoccus albus]
MAETNSITEAQNQKTMKLDAMSTREILQMMNEEDKTVPEAVNDEIISIEKAAQAAIHSFEKGGRLIYIGAGSSGRLGILDAAECPPTFGTHPEQVMGLIAGGEAALTEAVEGAEDDPEEARAELKHMHLDEKDTVIALAASGRTPYCIGGLEYSRQTGASTAAISCNKNARISDYADIPIEIEVGPEVLTGSTRLKAGTAQKLALNMISTSAMIGIGKIYQNLMVDVQPSNEKLRKRVKDIVSLATHIDAESSAAYLEKAGQDPKIAIIMIELQCTYNEAKARLEQTNGWVRAAVKLEDKEGDAHE